MLLLISILSCALLFSSEVFGEQELSAFTDNECNSETSSWTPWFNTQDPRRTNGNDIEDISSIRRSHAEAARCDSVSNVEYSVVGRSNNDTSLYETLVNNNGVFCMGSSTSPCPNYSVRFCCPLERDYTLQQCGQTFRQPLLNSPLRIVNGFEAIPHSLPWVVSLQYKGIHDCGGVIIDQWHILTAAHCLDYSNDLGNYYAGVGAHNRLSSGQSIPIAELVIHPRYDEPRSTDDIGIIRLAAPITFSQDIQPICLVDNIVEPQLDTTVYVAGWGNTVHQMLNSSSPILHQARLRVISDCSMYFAYEPQKQICTASNGPIDKDHGSCQGDRGGGLLYFKDGRWYAGGVVSYSIGCGQQAFPTVFTKTAAYIDWIREIINRPKSS